MLAHDYNKRGKNIVWPCYVQPKLDGTRAVIIAGKGIYSRNQKEVHQLRHILSEINANVPPGTILDGELYSDTLTFQQIVSIVKHPSKQPNEDQMKFHVYDIICDKPYEERYAMLRAIFAHPFRTLVCHTTEQCASESAMKVKHAEYVAEGYEGLMLRNTNGAYSNARSTQLQKYKEFFDEECEIVGFKDGEGAEEGCVIWMCTIDGKEFACRPRGTREERQELFAHGQEYVGQMLTVRYQEKTDDGLLRFPVGIAIRDYD
jgi:DNA ligase-1